MSLAYSLARRSVLLRGLSPPAANLLGAVSKPDCSLALDIGLAPTGVLTEPLGLREFLTLRELDADWRQHRAPIADVGAGKRCPITRLVDRAVGLVAGEYLLDARRHRAAPPALCGLVVPSCLTAWDTYSRCCPKDNCQPPPSSRAEESGPSTRSFSSRSAALRYRIRSPISLWLALRYSPWSC